MLKSHGNRHNYATTSQKIDESRKLPYEDYLKSICYYSCSFKKFPKDPNIDTDYKLTTVDSEKLEAAIDYINKQVKVELDSKDYDTLLSFIEDSNLNETIGQSIFDEIGEILAKYSKINTFTIQYVYSTLFHYDKKKVDLSEDYRTAIENVKDYFTQVVTLEIFWQLINNKNFVFVVCVTKTLDYFTKDFPYKQRWCEVADDLLNNKIDDIDRIK